MTVDSSGAHSVCVCTIHQNTHLVVDAFACVVNSHIRAKNRLDRQKKEENNEEHTDIPKFKVDYKDLMKKIVCDVDNMECMVHRCEKCSGGYEKLQTYIEATLEEYGIDDDIAYTQWDSTDRNHIKNVNCTSGRLR